MLYHDPEAARAAFSCTGEYARPLSGEPVEGFAFFEESPELSRRFRALKLWLSLNYHGVSEFRAAIGADLRHAQLLARLITAEPALELLAPVGLSVWLGGFHVAPCGRRELDPPLFVGSP